MGLLAPLYIAGLLAIGLPILFHLIRRTPHGRQQFSSLMFLSTSPPRLTRRSRLTHILLLILRAAAFALLAFAFARPFFHRNADQELFKSSGRRLAILVDTSASMRREDLWEQAKKQVDQVLREASPADEVALFLFDRQARAAFTFDEWNGANPSQRADLLRSRLASASPTWAPTKVGDALASVADQLAEVDGGKRGPDRLGRQIVLISDLQQGGHVETLQGHQWPENVLLEVRPVAAKQPTNAAVQFVKQSADGGERADARLRVRVSNQSDSAKEQFTLAWSDDRGPLAGVEPLKVYVPPGRSQIVRVAWPPAGRQANRLVLGGDDCDFDNTLYVVQPRTESVRVLHLGEDDPEDTKGLLYYLNSAAIATPQRKVDLVSRKSSEAMTDADLLGARLVVVAATPAADRAERVRRFAQSGGEVLWVLRDAAGTATVARVMGLDKLEAQEATGDFALVSRVDLEHPLLAPFADSRFADFTKIHFWHHRKVSLPQSAGARVIAWFEGGEPFLFEKPIGTGRVIVATSGWHPGDSQLALSTKFVPLIDGLLRRRDAAAVEAQYTVLEPIALPQVQGQVARSLVAPDGAKVELASGATTFDNADRPGIYKLTSGGEETPLAVNLPADESRTTPVAVEELERWGAKLGKKPPSEELVTRERRLRMMELENRQKLWRWLIVGVLGLLAAETALAGRLARRTVQQQATT
jgi:Aerotolerance regulator N-terminal/von Willebrand factor type A domain